jgi:hypothetical protein
LLFVEPSDMGAGGWPSVVVSKPSLIKASEEVISVLRIRV